MSSVQIRPGLPVKERESEKPFKIKHLGDSLEMREYVGLKITENPFKIKHLGENYFSETLDRATDLWYHIYMDLIMTLRGKTRHGKNRVSQHGPRWRVVREEDSVLCLDGKPGKWVVSIDCACSTCEKWGQDGRWIQDQNDPNFEILGSE